MTYWRSPRYTFVDNETIEAEYQARLRRFRGAWLSLTASLFLAAIAVFAWGFT